MYDIPPVPKNMDFERVKWIVETIGKNTAAVSRLEMIEKSHGESIIKLLTEIKTLLEKSVSSL